MGITSLIPFLFILLPGGRTRGCSTQGNAEPIVMPPPITLCKLSLNTNFFLLQGRYLHFSGRNFFITALYPGEDGFGPVFLLVLTGFISFIPQGPGDLEMCIPPWDTDIPLTLFPMGLIIWKGALLHQRGLSRFSKRHL